MAEIVLDEVSKVYPDGTLAVRDLNLTIANGEFMVLVGPSGCGKTTALRMIAGLEDVSGGTIRIGAASGNGGESDVVNDVPPRDRDVAMVFQNYALYPHLTVRDNMAFGLKLRRVPKAEIERRVRQAAETLGLEALLDRKPRALSGGQRQRVAMGRAIVREPRAFLMDEPLSNLDAKLRVQMRAEIARIQREFGVTTVYVTHDQIEAMTMGDRVAVMRRGMLEQVDEPQRLYDHPRNLFVAGFIGSPAMNMVEASIELDGEAGWVRFGSTRLRLDDRVLVEHPALADHARRPVALGIRPESMEDATIATGAPPDQRLRATVDLVEALGSELLVHFQVDGRAVITEDTKELVADPALAPATTATDAAGSTKFVARVDPRSAVKQGEPIELAVDTRRLHFFDIDTGLSISEAEALSHRETQ